MDDIVEGVVRVMKKAPDKKNGEDGLRTAFAPIGFAPLVPTVITTWERSQDLQLTRESTLHISPR